MLNSEGALAGGDSDGREVWVYVDEVAGVVNGVGAYSVLLGQPLSAMKLDQGSDEGLQLVAVVLPAGGQAGLHAGGAIAMVRLDASRTLAMLAFM